MRLPGSVSRVHGCVRGQVEPDAADRAVGGDPSEQFSAAGSKFRNNRWMTFVEEGYGTSGHRLEDRAAHAGVEQRRSCLDRFARVARIGRLSVLRLQQVHVPAASDVIRVSARTDQRPIDPVQRLVTVADRAREGQFESRLPLSASGKWRSCPPCRTRRC